MLLCGIAASAFAAEPEWNAASIEQCDRACLVGIMDAIFKHDPKLVPRGFGNPPYSGMAR
ncbi:MAG TPA: hypothetical protein VFW83_09945 [Bryobacteraceae bacterium]|nr:hypothetical protein [Bryobacteraceae bacterium]